MGILRSLFGPSKDEIWRQLSEEIGGEFVAGGFFGNDKVLARAGPWTITLDTYTVSSGKHSTTYTRMRAPFANKDGFRFTIYPEGIFSGIGRWLGMQDIAVGFPEFDQRYVIKGNDEEKARKLFAGERVRELIMAQPSIHLEVKDDEGWFGAEFPAGVDELCFHVVGVIKDVDRLKLLYELFAETLDQLCRIDSAYAEDPNMEL